MVPWFKLFENLNWISTIFCGIIVRDLFTVIILFFLTDAVFIESNNLVILNRLFRKILVYRNNYNLARFRDGKDENFVADCYVQKFEFHISGLSLN